MVVFSLFMFCIVICFCVFLAVVPDRTILMTYKHKTHAVDSDGQVLSNADVDFYINDVCSFLFLKYVISYMKSFMPRASWFS